MLQLDKEPKMQLEWDGWIGSLECSWSGMDGMEPNMGGASTIKSMPYKQRMQ